MNFTLLAIVAICLFGALGFWRGWLREVANIGGLLVSWLVLIAAGGVVIGVVNRINLMLAFAIRGGFDAANPNTLLQSIRQNPLIDANRPGLFYALLFAVLLLGTYLASYRFVPPPSETSARLLGTIVGVANGYLLLFLLVRYLGPALPIALLDTSAASLADILGRYLPTVLLAGVVLAILIALLSSRRGLQRSGGRMQQGRARG